MRRKYEWGLNKEGGCQVPKYSSYGPLTRDRPQSSWDKENNLLDLGKLHYLAPDRLLVSNRDNFGLISLCVVIANTVGLSSGNEDYLY